jgi:hypothetical protein
MAAGIADGGCVSGGLQSSLMQLPTVMTGDDWLGYPPLLLRLQSSLM